MGATAEAVKQHLIDPEICIRCNTCEAPCPTGAIDNWFAVHAPFSLDEQFSWQELPPRPPEGDLPDAAARHPTS